MNIGIHYNLPFSAYVEEAGMNQSSLKILRHSRKKFLYHITHRVDRDTPSKRLGRAIDTATLEPEKFNDLFFQLPELNLRTNAGKAHRDELIAANPGKEALNAEEFNTAFKAAGAVLSHPDAARLLASATRQMSIWWKDQETGILCKARLDAYQAQTNTIIDLKSTQDASPRGFQRGSIWAYRYDLQAAWYMTALEAHGIKPEHFVFIAVEKTMPFEVGVYRLTDEVIKLSKQENQALLRKYAECLRTDNWPGYTEGIVDIGVPKFGIEELEASYGESI